MVCQCVGGLYRKRNHHLKFVLPEAKEDRKNFEAAAQSIEQRSAELGDCLNCGKKLNTASGMDAFAHGKR